MTDALYGERGFFRRHAGPAAHFRTSVHASPTFGGALTTLLLGVDAALGHPSRLDLVDVGAGRGELLAALLASVPAELAARLRPVAVEIADRPAGLPAEIGWTDQIPARVVGLLVATEWLDNVPVEVAQVGSAGLRRVLVNDRGEEISGGRLTGPEGRWLDRWWPATGRSGRAPGPDTGRVEIGLARDEAWARAVSAVDRGLALAVDYGHLLPGRPAAGTLTGFRDGRQTRPVPDGSCDITAQVALDAVATAAGRPFHLLTQRRALHALGVDGRRPALALAATDPVAYLRALSAAATATELTTPTTLGAHRWLLHPRGIPLPPRLSDVDHDLGG
ncbi:SAM-dependent methyltransferase [Pilimelia columellifera]